MTHRPSITHAPCDVYEFANGIRLYRSDLLDAQLDRYADQELPLHEPVEERWFESLLASIDSEDACFLDIGAALGYYCVLTRRRIPTCRVIAVDPNPEFHQKFWKTLELNHILPEGVEHIASAVYPTGSSVSFARKLFSSHVVPAGRDGVSSSDSFTVPAITLEALVARIARPISIAKLDIQGAELEVLRSSESLLPDGPIQNWIVGTHGASLHKAVLDLMRKDHEILFEEQAPENQPDGVIVARKI